MKDIIVTAITLGIIGAVARLILPCSKKFIAWLINKLVLKAEKKIAGSNMGAAKKRYVCKKLTIFGVKTNEFIGSIIDGAVDAMNNKEMSVSSTLKNGVTVEITNSIERANALLKSTLHKGE